MKLHRLALALLVALAACDPPPPATVTITTASGRRYENVSLRWEQIAYGITRCEFATEDGTIVSINEPYTIERKK
jgi:hypothetical protein